MVRLNRILCSAAAASAIGSQVSAENLHFTYLWHLEQPIYWPDQKVGAPDRYEHAFDSLQRAGVHPLNNLAEIFGSADRTAVYQYRVKDAIDDIDHKPEAGAQVSYSGGLIHNVRSLGNANQLGYGPGWSVAFQQARANQTSGGKPRLDVVLFGFHHPLLPLVDENTVRKEVALYKAAYAGAWGGAVPMSQGFFPSEMAFSTRLIKPLVEEGVAWTFVSAEKISRANIGFPLVFGSGGVNCDPPNPADQVNPAQGFYFRQSISRGCGPAEAAPQSLTPQRARYADPATGQVYEIIVVPCSQSLGWKDGYAPIGTGDFQALNAHNDPSRPMLIVLAHDGDNAWGGGFTYYREATPNLVNDASNQGFIPTVVEQYLANHPVPADAVVHVEDGAWVNADGDFGAPQFINWNWPLLNAQGQIDVENGWHVDARNWAVITAMQNRVETAEQIAGSVRIDKVLNPDAGTSPAERAWHYFLGSLNSGYMYYGSSIDMEVKQSVACNEAAEHADAVIGNANGDQTPPTVWLPQRHPWNPGSVNFGPQYGYQQVPLGTDLWIWSFVYDASGLASVTLKYRADADGVNPLSDFENETYAGGAGVGPWVSVPMTLRDFPAGNVHNDPDIDFFEMPQYIADQYHAKLTGLSDVLIDYHIEATDTKGFTKRSPIQHVYIGAGSGGPGGGGDVVTVSPEPVEAGEPVEVQYDPAGRVLDGAAQVFAHVGFNHWAPTLSPDAPMSWDPAESQWVLSISVPTTAHQLDLVFNNGAGTWDNNSGQDWHFPVTGTSGPAFVMDGVLDAGTVLVAQNAALTLHAKLVGDELYIACPDAGEGRDHFIYLALAPGAMVNANWAKAGQIAQWGAFLADENDNDYEAWFDATGTRQATTGANGGVLEGTINLAEEFGALPQGVWLAVGAFASPDSGALQAQAPAPAVANGSIEANEYAYLDLTQFQEPEPCPGDANGDRVVDFDDIVAALANWLADYTPGTGEGDANGDGVVDFDDIVEVLSRWLQPC